MFDASHAIVINSTFTGNTEGAVNCVSATVNHCDFSENTGGVALDIVHPDGKRVIPFDTYNLLYRDGLEDQVLKPLRKRDFVPLTGPISLARYQNTDGESR